MLPEKYEDLLQRSCHKRNGTGKSRPEQDVATNGEESQTEILRSHFSHTSLEKDIMLGTMPGLRKQEGQQNEWSDDLVEWTGETIPDLARKADDRLAFRRFVYEVAHARESGTAS